MYSKVWEHWRWEYTLCFHIGYGNKSMVMSSLWSGHFHPTSGTIFTFKHFLRYIRTPSLFSWGVSGIQEYIYIFSSVLKRKIMYWVLKKYGNIKVPFGLEISIHPMSG